MIKKHETYIQKCFELAREYQGQTSPNPLVGALIVKDEKVIATGAHQKSGQPHAELAAILNAREDLNGATLYCNLEPCCHTNKKTPPCAQRIIQEGIKTVVISNLDPNPEVAGKGVELLRANGLEVITDILKEEGEELNRIFFHHITSALPYIHLKWAQTLDGKIQSASGSSKWITNAQSRAHVHQERLSYDGILVGANTLRNDNPALTVRNSQGEVIKTPKRIILSSSGDINLKSQVFTDEYASETILVTSNEKITLDYGELMLCPREQNGRIALNKLLMNLKENGITSLYVEGGSEIHSQFLANGLYNEISIYMAMKLMGNGQSAFFQNENLDMEKAQNLILHTTQNFGSDIYFNFRKQK
jgi:diaminohydroxyphosphoribosylaminopyrimidine deaminase/5-amino-6-(5-phosphoribosylamino)uracil reductase